MNKLIEELMLEVGYACPRMSERGQALAKRVALECIILVTDKCDSDECVQYIRELFEIDKPTQT